jgi:hypothetical protein
MWLFVEQGCYRPHRFRQFFCPQPKSQIGEIDHAKPFDDCEGCLRGGDQCAEAHGNQKDLKQETELKPACRPIPPAKSVFSPAGHRGERAGARRDADEKTGGKKGNPSVEGHGWNVMK